MANSSQFNKWELPKNTLRNLTAIKVRDLIIECFYVAQGGTFRKVKEAVKAPATDKDILNSVIAVIRVAFIDSGGDFEKPTKENLYKVLDFLAAKAASWGTPKDIIEHHKSQIKQAINLLK